MYEKGGANWDQLVASKEEVSVNWFPRWKEGRTGVLISCGGFPNVPLMGTRGCISYNPILAIRQLGYPVRGAPLEEELAPVISRGFDKTNMETLQKVRKAWEVALRSKLEQAQIVKERFKSAALKIRKENAKLRDINVATTKALEQETKRARALWGSNSELKLRREEMDQSRVDSLILKDELKVCSRSKRNLSQRLCETETNMLAIVSRYQEELNLATAHEHRVADKYAQVYAEKEARGRAMLGMRQLMEKNVATAAAVSSAAEADLTLLATAHHPPPNVVGRGRSRLGHNSNPHLGYNRVAYPYGLPPNFTPLVMQDDAGHPDEVHEDHQEYAQGDVEFYPPIPVEGPTPNTLPQPNLTAQPIFLNSSNSAPVRPKAPAPIQREAPQAPAPTMTCPTGNAHFGVVSNAMRNFPLRPIPEFTPLPMTYEDLLSSLIANQMAVITLENVYQPLFPKWYDPNATCTYHGNTLGHSIKKCLALKYKVQHLIDTRWLTFQEDRPNVKTNPLANHGGGAVNSIESNRPRRSKPLKDVATPRRFIFEALQKGCVIPHGGHEEDSCLLHPGELQNMESCLSVRELLQRMIDQGRLEVGDEGREEQHISKLVPFPYQNSHAVPWRYTPPSERKKEAIDISSLSAKVTNITGLSGVTHSGHVFAPPDLPTQPANVKGKAKMVEEQNDKTTLTPNEDIPVKGLPEKRDGCGKKEVSLEEASEFLRII
ncbi:hypothetical protein HKD37_14G040392 [Glycine soja]